VELRGHIVADRLTLEALMHRAQISQSPQRQATARLLEKVARLKLRLDDLGDGGLHLLEAPISTDYAKVAPRAVTQPCPQLFGCNLRRPFARRFSGDC